MPSIDQEPVRIERDGPVALFYLQRGKVNAMDLELLAGIETSLDKTLSSDVHAIVITGTGNAFSAGVDLFRLLDGGPDYINQFLESLCSTFKKLFAYPKPIIAAVNGHAIAGGCVLTCACDYRIMADGTSTIGVPELLVGVPFPAIALETMRFVTPPQHVQHLIYTGRTVLPSQALQFGLIDEVVPADGLMRAALEKAQKFAAIPPGSFAAVKQQLRGPILERISRTDPREILDLWKSPEVHHVIREYLKQTVGRKRE
jgi:enoyl-CoA hydratase